MFKKEFNIVELNNGRFVVQFRFKIFGLTILKRYCVFYHTIDEVDFRKNPKDANTFYYKQDAQYRLNKYIEFINREKADKIGYKVKKS